MRIISFHASPMWYYAPWKTTAAGKKSKSGEKAQ